jgi:uncharacterized protein
MRYVSIINRTRGTILGRRLMLADEPASRRRGLLGSEYLPDGHGLLIVPCRQVHTFGMKYPIDVIFIDGSYEVKRCVEGLKPWRLSPFLLSSGAVLELPCGKIRESRTEAGDMLGLLDS